MTVLRRLTFDGSDRSTADQCCHEVRPARRWGEAARANGAETRRAGLACAIEGEVIPRLLAAHRARRQPGAAPRIARRIPVAEDVAELASILLANDPAGAAAFIEATLARCDSLETVCLDLMTPAARRLGDLWVADLCHFMDVTMALGQLQHLLRRFGGHACRVAAGREYGRRALLVSAPGEQHTFGALMVAEFLRRAGWDVSGEVGASGNEVVAGVRDEWFALVGLSVSSEHHLGALASTIRAIRCSSRNAAVVIMVGGNVFLEHPDFVARVGADVTAVDARHAVIQAEDAVAELSAPSLARGGA